MSTSSRQASRPVRIDVHFIAASNQDLERLMAKGEFRRDFFYRLRGVWLHLPPLRDRRDDIPILINRFLDEIETGRRPKAIEKSVKSLLLAYNYPGNIRELQSILDNAANLAQGGSVSISCLPSYLKKPE
jgi:transcriptional regulator with PAS, ATPase and Fis domain